MSDLGAKTEARALRMAVARLQRSFRTTRGADCPTPAQLSALGSLHRAGPLATGELAARECLKPQSVTRLVAALAKAGLIERVVDGADRRRVVVAITTEGRRRLAREMRRRDERLELRLQELSSADRAILAAAAPLLEWLGGAE
jgi:DNA-binding MarR family transcriptional regulator